MLSICTLAGDFFATVFLFAGLFGFFVTFPPATFVGETFVFGAFLAFVGAKIRISVYSLSSLMDNILRFLCPLCSSVQTFTYQIFLRILDDTPRISV